jgi:anti-sigma-K factor RskA
VKDHEEGRRLIATLLVDGLVPEDRRRLEHHLAGCSTCRQELDELTALAELLGTADLAPEAFDAPSVEATPAGRDDARPSRRRLAPLAIAGVAAVLTGVLVAVTVTTGPRPGTAAVALDGTAGAVAGTASFQELDTGVGVALRVSGLDRDRSGVYETWLTGQDGALVSLGTFEPAPEGETVLRLHGSGDLDHYRSLAITAEPNRTDPARNGPTVATATVPTT